jgi:hypothetical protein
MAGEGGLRMMRETQNGEGDLRMVKETQWCGRFKDGGEDLTKVSEGDSRMAD